MATWLESVTATALRMHSVESSRRLVFRFGLSSTSDRGTTVYPVRLLDSRFGESWLFGESEPGEPGEPREPREPGASRQRAFPEFLHLRAGTSPV